MNIGETERTGVAEPLELPHLIPVEQPEPAREPTKAPVKREKKEEEVPA